MKARTPLLITAIALNLLAAALYLWALQDHTTIAVSVEGSHLTATVNGKSVAAMDSTYPTGKIGLMLEDYHSYRTYVSSFEFTTGVRQWLEQIGDWILRSNAPPAWADIRITGPNSGDLQSDFRGRGPLGWAGKKGAWHVNLLGEYQPSMPDTALTGSAGWKNYVIEARLARGKGRAGILVRAQDAGTGYLFWLRPENGDMGWYLLKNGLPAAVATDGSSFALTFISGLKALLREILWSYFFGLAILVIILLLSLPLAILLGKCRFSFRLPKLRGSAIWAAAVIAILGAAIAATVAIVLLSRIPHVQDSVTYLFQAKTLALGRLSVPAPPLPDFFAQEFLVVREGAWFGKYPPGHPLVLAIGVLLGAPWLVSPILGGLSLFLVYLAGRSLYTTRIGLLASLLGLLSPFFIFMSGSFMAHSTGLFFICLFLLAFVKMTRSRKLAWALVAGFALGFAAITKQLTALSLSLPFGLYFIYLLIRHTRYYADRMLVFLAGATVPLTFLLIYNWSLTGDPFTDTYQLYWFFDKIGFGEAFGGAGGHTPEQGLRNTWANLTTLQFHLFGWPSYVTLALPLIPFASLRASRWDWMFLSGFFLLAASYVFYWADGIMFGPRYYYESLPMLVLLTARGISLLPKLAQDLWGLKAKWAGSAAWAVSALLLLVLIVYNLVFYMPIEWGIYQDYNYVGPKAQRLVEAAGLKNALVFVPHEPTWQWWKYGCVFSANSPLLDSDVVYARDLGDREDAKLMEYFPNRQYYRLTESSELVPLQD